MCLIVIAWQIHPEYPLIVTANRDEYYQRPTATAQQWKSPSDILAGRDLQAGGTWLGVTQGGKFAAVTNYREGVEQTTPKSRGDLTTGFLKDNLDAGQHAEKVIEAGDQYNGFNLLLGEDNQLIYCSNRHSEIQRLSPGIYTLSNELLDSPWPKAIHAKEVLTPLLKKTPINIDEIINCLHRRDPFPDEHLPDTGIGIEMERMLSPPFIVSKDYGTRCTTVVLKDRKGNTHFVEQNYLEDGSYGERKEFKF